MTSSTRNSTWLREELLHLLKVADVLFLAALTGMVRVHHGVHGVVRPHVRL
jgi:hypothetical protein